MNTYALPALKEKRAELSGKVIALQKQIARIHKEIEHLDTTIQLFDPSYVVGSIAPKAHYKRLLLFKLGELGRTIFDALRTAGEPQSTKQVAAFVAERVGQPEHAAAFNRRIRANLAYLERRGKVVKIGERESARWRITS